MNEEKISQKAGYGEAFASEMAGNCVQMANQDGIKDIRNSSVNEGIGEPTQTEIAIALNTLAREQMKKRLLNDILIDLNVCKIEGFDIKEYANDLKREIDGIVEQVENKQWKDK